MEKTRSLAETIKHRGKNYSLRELPDMRAIRVTEVELRIVNARLVGLSVAQLDAAQVRTTGDQIMLQASAITGCPMPQTDFFAEVLTTTMMNYLIEFGYGELTLTEIVLALQLNTQGGLRLPSGLEVEKVSFFGVCFNIDFLSRILSNYMIFRNNLDRKFENFIDGYA